MSFRERIRRELSGPALPLTAFGIALNLTAGQLTAALKLPIYLDSLGTILLAVLVGPWSAIVAGSFGNILSSALGNPPMMFFIPVVLVIGVVTAALARMGWFRDWRTVVLGGLLLGIIGAVVSAPIAAYVFGGTMLAGTDALVILFRSFGSELFRSTLYQGLISDPADKIISFLVIFFLVRRLPRRVVTRFPGAANVTPVPPA